MVNGYSISNIQWSDRVGETKVTISKDGQFATLTFNEALLSQGIQNPVVQRWCSRLAVPRLPNATEFQVPTPIQRAMPVPQIPTPPPHILPMIGVVSPSQQFPPTAAPPIDDDDSDLENN